MTTKSIQNNIILDALFTSRARVEVLKLFYLRSSTRHYVREIASLTDQPVRAVQRELARLEKAGLLQSSVDGNRKYFQANRESPVFPDLRSLMIKSVGVGDELRRVLHERAASIQTAFIFGSFAQGRETASSDIDLMVIGDLTSRELSVLLSSLKAQLDREFNPISIRAAEFQDNLEKGDAFTLNVLEEPKIYLVGGEDELQKLAG